MWSTSPTRIASRAMSTRIGCGNPEPAIDRASASTDGGRPLVPVIPVSLRSTSVPPPIDPVEIEVVRLDPDLPLPAYAHDGDAGVDLCRPWCRHDRRRRMVGS